MSDDQKHIQTSSNESSAAPLSDERVAAALRRVEDLWPEGLEAVPGSYEVAMKQDADTLRALAEFWRRVTNNGTRAIYVVMGHEDEPVAPRGNDAIGI